MNRLVNLLNTLASRFYGKKYDELTDAEAANCISLLTAYALMEICESIDCHTPE